jgi:NNP family nitrate/nitrite transporter-like MFS transporter
MSTDRTDRAVPRGDTRRPALMLALATVGFAVNFWAWALLSPLGPRFKELLGLSAAQQALLVAVPVIVGSVGRIPVGALTDRFGGRVMFPLISAATIVPVLVTVFAVVALCAAVEAFTPPLMMLGTLAFLTTAAALGAGSGATFALVAVAAPADKVGSVTGLVGAAGGLGGFVPPLVMGFVYGLFGSYGLGLALLAGVSVLALVLTVTAVRATAMRRSAGPPVPFGPSTEEAR